MSDEREHVEESDVADGDEVLRVEGGISKDGASGKLVIGKLYRRVANPETW